ncbi:MAG: uracil-DNA glycosylase family protein [Planctomycetota bacterium]
MSHQLLDAAARLRDACQALAFAPPVDCVYNPLQYAWDNHAAYIQRYGSAPKRVLFLGMNPGPFGMVQTGIPFGEVPAVRDWLALHEAVGQPDRCHRKRPVQGLDCHRSEVSGRRLWGLFAERFGTPAAFFREHFVVNYCPLAFAEDSGRNRTPDKLPAAERDALYAHCDEHLRRCCAILRPTVLVGIGHFARQRAELALGDQAPSLATVLHPSPANPKANAGWAEAAVAQLREQGIW